MKVKIIRKVITTVEEVVDLTPEQYCELRADLSPLRTNFIGNVDIEIKTFEPLEVRDEEELYDFFQKKKLTK